VRALFLLLLAASLGFFAWARFLSAPDPAIDPQPLAQQIEPQKLRVVQENELATTPPPAAPKPKPGPAPAARSSAWNRWRSARGWPSTAARKRPAGGCSFRPSPTAPPRREKPRS
jgi:hypothetical protein